MFWRLDVHENGEWNQKVIHLDGRGFVPCGTNGLTGRRI